MDIWLSNPKKNREREKQKRLRKAIAARLKELDELDYPDDSQDDGDPDEESLFFARARKVL